MPIKAMTIAAHQAAFESQNTSEPQVTLFQTVA